MQRDPFAPQIDVPARGQIDGIIRHRNVAPARSASAGSLDISTSLTILDACGSRSRQAEVDVVNTLRGGRVQPGELVAGTYRYRVETSRIAVVVAFRSEKWAIVITAWRFKR